MAYIIRNFQKLATNSIRTDALKIAEAGYESLKIETILNNAVRLTHKSHLHIQNQSLDLAGYNNVYLIGIGKGSSLVAKHLLKLIGSWITQGGIIDIRKKLLRGKVKSYVGTHPLPTEKNIAATNKLIQILRQAGPNDLILCIICGGGSSLFCQPAAGHSCLDLKIVADHLLKSGASIQQINTVRKHLSLIHGGNVARYAHPAEIVSMIISDVPGDRLDMIASGPTVLDPTTVADAKAIAVHYGLGNLNLIETPKLKEYFKKVTNHIIANGSLAVDAMMIKATELGYKPRVYSYELSGLAVEQTKKMVAQVDPNQALLACGETQVVVRHAGKGGRNQDFALSSLAYLPSHSATISAASDGKDNIAVAGGLVDTDSVKPRLDPLKLVELNQSYYGLKKLNGLFFTRPVTANVSDFCVILRK